MHARDMKEIYFIANSRNARTLIEKLQPLTGATIGIATDLAQGLKDVFDRHPAVVFIQNEIEGIPGEKLAKKIRAILDDATIRFVLLHEDADSIRAKAKDFDASYNISQPDDELCRQILQFLITMPDTSLADDEKVLRIENGPDEVVAESPTPPEDMEKVLFPEFLDSDVVTCNEKPLPADDQILHITMKPEELLLESFLPVKEQEIVSVPDVGTPELPGNCEETISWNEEDMHINWEVIEESAESFNQNTDEYMASCSAAAGSEHSTSGELSVPETGAEEADTIQKNSFPLPEDSQETFGSIKPESLFDHLFKQPAEEPSVTTPDAGASSLLPHAPSPSAGGVVATAGLSGKDFRRVDRESPNQLFGSMTDEAINPPFCVIPDGNSKIIHKGKPSLGALNHRASFSRVASEQIAPDTGSYSGDRKKEFSGTPNKAGITGQAAALNAGLYDMPPLTKTTAYPHKGILVSLIAVLTLATVFLALQWYYDGGTSGLSVSQGSPADKPLASPPPAQTVLPEQELPKFIPRVAPDSLFALAHPGWERYEAESLEYNIYRERGRIKAIQVMAGITGVITVPFLTSCIRESSGNEEYIKQGEETRNDFKIIRGTLLNKGEVAIYQKMPEGAIRGFVLTMP